MTLRGGHRQRQNTSNFRPAGNTFFDCVSLFLLSLSVCLFLPRVPIGAISFSRNYNFWRSKLSHSVITGFSEENSIDFSKKYKNIKSKLFTQKSMVISFRTYACGFDREMWFAKFVVIHHGLICLGPDFKFILRCFFAQSPSCSQSLSLVVHFLWLAFMLSCYNTDLLWSQRRATLTL